MIFYVGAHHAHWLWSEPLRHPIFMSNRTLLRYKKFKPALHRWALDSGGFTELKMFGGWETTAKHYADRIKMYESEIGNLDWASQQDWMCEPFMLNRTGRTVKEHQELTINNYIELNSMDLKTPIVPVIQGWEYHEYMDHIDMYSKRNINLVGLPVVGLGSVCRRGKLHTVRLLVSQLNSLGINIHCFGIKTDGIPLFGDLIKSADSMAWSLRARWAKEKLCGISHPSKSDDCSHCKIWAMMWADKIIDKVGYVKL